MGATNRFRGALDGLAVGDALGTAVEFSPRGSFPRLTEMIGGGAFHLRPGQWTDDTSMALCLATSLVERRGFDARDQMERYCRWREKGYLSSTGTCFDIGTTTSTALSRYRCTGDPYTGSTDPHAAGNGSIMRLAPIPICYYPDAQQVAHYAAESSRTTHGALECLDACRLLGLILLRALLGQPKDEVLCVPVEGLAAPAILALARGDYRARSEREIVGSGYVVKSLEAALWCFWTTDSFEEAVVRAVNLGDDADTTGAIVGQVAGAFYGAESIPPRWLAPLALRAEIESLADRLRVAAAAT